jgi:hypothetical protein
MDFRTLLVAVIIVLFPLRRAKGALRAPDRVRAQVRGPPLPRLLRQANLARRGMSSAIAIVKPGTRSTARLRVTVHTTNPYQQTSRPNAVVASMASTPGAPKRARRPPKTRPAPTKP